MTAERFIPKKEMLRSDLLPFIHLMYERAQPLVGMMNGASLKSASLIHINLPPLWQLKIY